MIIKIKIFSPLSFCRLIIDGDKNLIEYNGMQKTKNVENEIKKFIEIFSSWKDNYTIPRIFDIEDFNVTVKENGKSKTISGCGNFPDNYSEFKELIGEIIKCF